MKPHAVPREVLTLAEAARYLRISARQCRTLATQGVIPSYRLTATGPRFVRLDDLRAVIAQRVAATMANLPIEPEPDAPVPLRRSA